MLAVLLAETSDRPAWWLVGATFALVAAAWVALLSLFDARKSRHGAILAEVSGRWDAPAVIDSSVLFRQYGPDGTKKLVDSLWGPGVVHPNPQDIADWQKISVYPNLIETIGVFVAARMISPRLVFEMWGGNIIQAWNDFEPATQRLRELSQTAEFWKHFEGVANAMKWFVWAEQNGLYQSWRFRVWIYTSRVR